MTSLAIILLAVASIVSTIRLAILEDRLRDLRSRMRVVEEKPRRWK